MRAALASVALGAALAGAAPAPAVAADPVDVLVYTATYGFRHGSIDAARKQFQALGETPEFDVAFTEKASDINGAELKDFDVLVFVNATGNQPYSADQKQELLDWLATGKGIVATHAAVDANYSWSDYGDVIGAYFHSHPHTGVATNVVEDRSNPISAHLPERFEIEEEYYRLQLNPRENVHVLASLDRASAGDNGQTYVESQPTMWCQEIGGGRAFTTLWGHFDATYTNAPVWQSIVQGLRYAAGTLKADCSVKTVPGRLQAETADVIAGSEKEASPFDGANQVVTRIIHDGYILFRDLEISNVKSVKVSAAPETAPVPSPYAFPQATPALGGTVSVVLDDLGYDNQALGGSGPTYKVAGSAEIAPASTPPSTALDGALDGDGIDWTATEIPLDGVKGRHDVYVVFTNGTVSAFNPTRILLPQLQESSYLASVDWVEFPGLRETPRPAAPAAPSSPRSAALFEGARLPSSLRASRAHVRVRFPAGAFPAGTAVSGRLTANPQTYGSGRTTAVARKRTTLTLRLSARARRALARSRRVKAKLTVVANAPDGSAATRTRSVTIKR